MNIYGASGHAKVIIDILTSISVKVNCLIDDNIEIKELAGFKVHHQFTRGMYAEPMVIAIGKNLIRKKICQKIDGTYSEALIHNSAQVSNSAKLDKGSVVMANSVINASAKIGKHCIINTSTVVEHDVVLGDFVHISPGAVVTGNVKIGEGTQVGANASVIPGIKIGKWVNLGAGTVLINDVPDYAVVVGNPGKIIKFNKPEYE